MSIEAVVARAEERIRVLASAMRTFSGATTNLDELLDAVAKNVATNIGDSCVLLALSEDGTMLDPVAAHAVDPGALARVHALVATDPFLLATHPAAKRILETGESVLVPHVSPEAFAGRTTSAYLQYQKDQGIHSLLAVALRAHGVPLGLITLTRYREESPPFDEGDQELATHLADLAALAISNARLYDAERNARLEAEEAMRSRARAESRFDRLANAGMLGILVGRIDGTVTDINPYIERLLGYSREDIVSGRVKWSSLTPPEFHDVDERAKKEIREAGVCWLREKELVRADGTRAPVMLGSAVVAGGPDIISFVLDLSERKTMERDLDERKRNEAALQSAKDEVVAANAELETFSYSVAHDLRAPLRGMDGFAKLLIEDYGKDLKPDARSYVERIRANATRMGALIDGLLELARLKRTTMRRQRIDLSALAKSIANHAVTEGSPVEVVIADDLVVNADYTLLHALVDNLFGNALKFSRKKEKPRVELGVAVQDGERVFFVKDNGAGFDMRFAKKLFVPFERLHGYGEFEGTGIGLATVQRIVARHGGRIWAEGVENEGATFFFTLPESSPTDA